MRVVEGARVACVTISPAIVFDAGSEALRIEITPLDAWRLRNLLDALLQNQFAVRDFPAESEAEYLKDYSSP